MEKSIVLALFSGFLLVSCAIDIPTTIDMTKTQKSTPQQTENPYALRTVSIAPFTVTAGTPKIIGIIDLPTMPDLTDALMAELQIEFNLNISMYIIAQKYSKTPNQAELLAKAFELRCRKFADSNMVRLMCIEYADSICSLTKEMKNFSIIITASANPAANAYSSAYGKFLWRFMSGQYDSTMP